MKNILISQPSARVKMFTIMEAPVQPPLSRSRVEAATKTFAWLGFRSSTSHVSNCVELAYQPDEKRRMSARCAMVNKVRSSVATSRDGRAASPREVDASLHVVMDGASAGAASSLRLEKQVRLARALPGLGRSAGIDCPPPPPPHLHTRLTTLSLITSRSSL